jgi:hypothetical protein
MTMKDTKTPILLFKFSMGTRNIFPKVIDIWARDLKKVLQLWYSGILSETLVHQALCRPVHIAYVVVDTLGLLLYIRRVTNSDLGSDVGSDHHNIL